MELNKIYLGNSLDTLKTFPDESVNCCVTSPPYWGLRDYGTAEWIGGDTECSHKRDNKCNDNCSTGQRLLEGAIGDGIYKTQCPRCGAMRKDEQLGLEETPQEYVLHLAELFREVKRVLKNDGTLWLNLGDSYAGSGKGQGPNGADDPKNNKTQGMEVETLTAKSIGLKPKDLVGIPWMVAFALRDDGWWLRQDIIWHKPGPMPEPVTDRCVKAHEYVFLMSKSKNYYFDYESLREPISASYAKDKRPHGVLRQKFYENSKYVKYGMIKANEGEIPDTERAEVRNKRSVWTVNTKPYSGAHFATFPEKLIEPMIKAGCPEGGVVLDTFMGAGTTALVAKKLGRNYVGCELNPEYIKIAEDRITNDIGLFL